MSIPHNFKTEPCDVTVVQSKDILKFTASDVKNRNPVKFVFAIDTSMSMRDSAGIKGNQESMCYGRLDLVKHAVNCLVDCLDDRDQLGIVEYNSDARVIFEIATMTPDNKSKVLSLVNALRPGGSTNIWEGLEKSLHMCTDCAVLLFTDGQPTVGITTIDKYLGSYRLKHPMTNNNIYTFGFSNDVNSELLDKIANVGHGQFYFIPDSTMIFTIITNFLANYFTLYGYIYINKIFKGPLYYEQSRYVNLSDGPIEVITLDNKHIVCNPQILNNTDKIGTTLLEVSKLITETLIPLACQSKYKEAQTAVRHFIIDVAYHDILDYLSVNINDQVHKAVSREYFNTWGRHYLYSFVYALTYQVNNNFKDMVVQLFGGTLFNSLKDSIDNRIVKLKPPPPSLTFMGQIYQVSSMSTFSQSSNPCFLGENRVLMEGGGIKLVRHIKAGDRVITPHGISRVNLILKTDCTGHTVDICRVGNLFVTPWHPIMHHGVWKFPNELSNPVPTKCEVIYSFLLEEHHIMTIEHTNVICLAHGYTEGILNHPFWGTNKVIESLIDKPGFKDGEVCLQYGCAKINPETGIVDELV